jgi:hypothetical protein
VHHVARVYHPETPFDHTVILDCGSGMETWRLFQKEESMFMAVVDRGEGIINSDLYPWDQAKP